MSRREFCTQIPVVHAFIYNVNTRAASCLYHDVARLAPGLRQRSEGLLRAASGGAGEGQREQREIVTALPCAQDACIQVVRAAHEKERHTALAP